MEFIGYHGTSTKKARAILNGDFYTPSKMGWLGTGIYFFDDNPELASSFAKYKHGINISILKCKVDVEESKVIDVTDPLGRGTKEFHKERHDFIEAFKGSKIDIVCKNGEFDKKVFERLCVNKGYELVRANTYTYSSMDHELRMSSHVPNGTELCLRNKSKITEKSEIHLDYAI